MIGTRIGSYEVLDKLGEGGMGEVYRARDTRLDRTVAIKVLPAALSSDPDARARFRREARALSQLTHPHICTLYDIGEHGDADYVVMELIDGETLAARIDRGPLPLTQTIEIGAQIAGALDRAHRAGIVHRDLKPANVMLTPSGAKLVDFGLAKAVAPLFQAGASGGTTMVRSDVTSAGMVVGTIQYMAPEQIEGQPADARSDIFALGEVLFEMAAGRRAFEGNSAAGIAAAILSADPPPVSSLRQTAPPALDRIVRGCLEKSPDKRWQSAHDVAALLQMIDLSGGAEGAERRSRLAQWMPWLLAAGAAAAAIAGWLRPVGIAAPAAAPVTFNLPPPPGAGFLTWVEGSGMALSPDGTQIAVVSSNGGVWRRPLNSLALTAVAGAEGANGVFWSFDGRSIAFFGGGMLKRVDATGGAAVPLCSVSRWTGHNGSWGRDAIVYSAVNGAAILRIPTGGGAPVELVKPDAARRETRLLWPHFLPDGQRFLYTAWRDDRSGRLMLWQPDGPPREIMQVTSNVEYIEPGYLLFVREGTLLARPFDAATAVLNGDPIAVAQPVNYTLIPGLGHFTSSRNGVIAYQSHSDRSRVAWFDPTGKEAGTVRPTGRYQSVRLSPDERQVLFDRGVPGIGTSDLWQLDLERGVETPLTSDPGNEIRPVPIRNRSLLVYAAGTSAAPQIVVRDLSTGADRPLHPENGLQVPEDVAPDNGSLLYRVRPGGAGVFHLRLIPLIGGTPTPLLDTRFNYSAARFSPTGDWLAYVSDESSELEAYVTRWPAAGERVRVSTDGARHPRWSRDGRQLFFLSRAGLVGVPMSPAGPGKPALVLDRNRVGQWVDYDVARDGRFIAIVEESVGAREPLTVLVNWRPR